MKHTWSQWALLITNSFALALSLQSLQAVETPNDGDWSATHLILRGTPEATLMVRVGDIDNLGFNWPVNFDPFSGASTPGHPFPWTVNTNDPAGTDRIMVVTSYNGAPPAGSDGYTGSTSRPGNAVQPITLDYDLQGIVVADGAFQIFVDDFQAPSWRAVYEVTLNGQSFPELSAVINALNQTGPVGKLISVPVPGRFLPALATGQIVLVFDDLTTGAGDGYAIDFVKLLINRAGTLPTGTITGHVTDATSHLPLAGARVASFDREALTDSTGTYQLTGVPAGLAFVEASAAGYQTANRTIDLLAGQTVANIDLQLARSASSLNIYVATELEFFGHAGSLYTLQYSGDLKNWSDDESIQGDGAWVIRFRSTRPASHRYWRVTQK